MLSKISLLTKVIGVFASFRKLMRRSDAFWEKTVMDDGQISYNNDLQRFELHGKALSEGDALEVFVEGIWIPGHLAFDSKGWHLMTSQKISIDMREGLLVRYPRGYVSVSSISNGHAVQG
jgi:hypothetical protein